MCLQLVQVTSTRETIAYRRGHCRSCWGDRLCQLSRMLSVPGR